MKLKVKIPLIFSILLLLFTISTFFYLRIFSSNKVFENIKDFKKDIEREDAQLVKETESISSDQTKLLNFLTTETEMKNVYFTVYNENFEELFVFKDQEMTNKMYLLSNVYPIKVENDRNYYFIKIEHPILIKQFINEMLFKNSYSYLYFILVVIIIFSILFLFFHYSFTIPINRLNHRLIEFSVRKKLPPLKVKRKDEIGELFMHVEEMEKRMYENHSERVNMVGSIAHDLKTPLTSIHGFLELIQINKNLSESQIKEYLALIFKKTQHIRNLVDEFSLYVKSEMELNDLNVKIIPLDSFLNSIAQEYDAELGGLGYDFSWGLNFSSNNSVRINEEMLRRVFGNIFSNAVRYGGKEKLKLYMKGFTANEAAVIVIEDNGIGVPEDQLMDIFKMFYTVDASRQIEKGGTGLGLASCKSIIESHEGTIKAFSSSYGGLGIQIEIPLA